MVGTLSIFWVNFWSYKAAPPLAPTPSPPGKREQCWKGLGYSNDFGNAQIGLMCYRFASLQIAKIFGVQYPIVDAIIIL